MAEKKNTVKVRQQIVDPVTLTNLGYKTVEVSEEDAPAASQVKHVVSAGFDDSAKAQESLTGNTVASGSQSKRVTEAAQATEEANKEQAEKEAKLLKDAEAATPTVGQVKDELKAKGRK